METEVDWRAIERRGCQDGGRQATARDARDGGCRDTEDARTPGRRAPGTEGTGNAEGRDTEDARTPGTGNGGRRECWGRRAPWYRGRQNARMAGAWNDGCQERWTQKTVDCKQGRGLLPSLAGVEGKHCWLVERCGRDVPLLQLSTVFTYFNRIFGFLTRILYPGDSLLPFILAAFSVPCGCALEWLKASSTICGSWSLPLRPGLRVGLPRDCGILWRDFGLGVHCWLELWFLSLLNPDFNYKPACFFLGSQT